MADTTKFAGGCHCGAVRYSVSLDPEKPAVSCNCSMCSKAGTLLSFAPADDFELESGEDSLSEYRFNKNVIAHLFCRTCGIKSFARAKQPDGAEMVAVNVRCLDDIDLEAVPVFPFDGLSA